MDQERTEDKRNEVLSAFAEAEDDLKLAERVSGDVALPAVNQLRYALCHLLEDDFEAAIRHCVRARYDAYEAARRQASLLSFALVDNMRYHSWRIGNIGGFSKMIFTNSKV